MIIETPKFDAALNKILDDLKPHERDCLWSSRSPFCDKRFHIAEEDIKFYKKLFVPPPKLCPACRRLRRLSFALTLRFYKNRCSALGHTESVISLSPPDGRFKMYDWDYYRTYDWQPLSYGVSVDFQNPVFDTMWSLRQVVPQPVLIRDPSNVNSDYTVNGRNLKNAYFVSGGWNTERAYYSVTISQCSDIMDSYFAVNSTNSYTNVHSRNINDSDWIYFSNDCYSCRFMYDSKNCHDCFGCVNLRNRSYCFFNEQLTREEYQKRLKSINVGNRKSLGALEKKFWNFVKSQPVRATRNEKTQNVEGNFILESRDCYECYVAEKCQKVRFGEMTIGNRDAMDYCISGGSELLYETVAVGSKCSNVKFSFSSKFITDSEFVINCRHVSNCFGCIGLENQSYCIFNKKYKPEEYAKIVDGLKTAMLDSGDYGEFFSPQFSSYAYNDSFANLVFPLSQEDYESLGAVWFDQPEQEFSYRGGEVLQVDKIPSDIEKVEGDILKKVLICEVTGRPFKIIPDELAFYRTKHIPLPTIHPNERIRRRYILANPYRTYDERCSHCGTVIKSMYQSKDGFKPYCEDCYQSEVV